MPLATLSTNKDYLAKVKPKKNIKTKAKSVNLDLSGDHALWIPAYVYT